MKKMIFCLLMASTAIYGKVLSPKAQELSQKLQSLGRTFLKEIEKQDSDSYFFPGVYASFSSLDLPFPLLRKFSIRLISKIQEKIKSSDLRHRHFVHLLWADGQKKEALDQMRWLGSPLNSLFDLYLNLQRINIENIFLYNSMLLIENKSISQEEKQKFKKFFDDMNDDMSRQPFARRFEDIDIVRRFKKTRSFYEARQNPILQNKSEDADSIFELMKNHLLKYDSDFIFFPELSFEFPDILKKIILKMNVPSPWPREKIEKLGYNRYLLLSSSMPFDQALPFLIQSFEKEITPKALKEIFKTGNTRKKISLMAVYELAYCYHNLPQPKFKEAFQLLRFAQKEIDLDQSWIYHPSFCMQLASVYCAGYGTPIDHQKGFFFFQKSFSQKSNIKSKLEVLLATFVYWFEIPLPNHLKKDNLSDQDLYEVFTKVIHKGLGVKNCLLQMFVDINLVVVWDMLYKLFHEKKQDRTIAK
jgi:hypothetical protein